MWWKKIYAVKLSPDSTIHASADIIREVHQIPENQRFVSLPTKDKGVDVNQTNLFNAQANLWTPIAVDCLKEITMADKLMIIAHGSDDSVAGLNAYDFSIRLSMWGVQQVGLITFRCCDVGRKNFLDDLHNECKARTPGISVGWFKGYRGSVYGKKISSTKSVEKVYDKHRGVKGLFGGKGTKKTGDKRFKIVQGTKPIHIEDTRYLLEPGDGEVI